MRDRTAMAPSAAAWMARSSPTPASPSSHRARWRLWLALMIGACVPLLASVAAAQGTSATEASPTPALDAPPVPRPRLVAELALETTYVFRGVPQYVTEETPSLQAFVEGALPSSSRGARWFGGVWLGAALSEREANAKLGSSTEIDVALGRIVELDSPSELRYGAMGFFRPEDDPIDTREELFLRYDRVLRRNDRLRIAGWGVVHAEVFRLLGAWAQVGAVARGALEFGFHAQLSVEAGASYYFREGVERFNSVGGQGALVYVFSPELEVLGYFNAAISDGARGAAQEFFDRYGVFWSGVAVQYVPPL